MNLKKIRRRLSKFFRIYSYPGFSWSMEIGPILKSLISEDSIIIDAPCGNGIISFWLVKNFVNKNPFELYDISNSAIDIAKNLILDQYLTCHHNIHIEKKDIFKIEKKCKSNDIWLLINSLYCLPDIDQLLINFHPRVEYIISIFPYLDHKNYTCFCKQFPNFININEMTYLTTVDFFNKYNYRLKIKKDITFIPYFCLSKIGIFNKLLLPTLNLIDKLVPGKRGSYWLGVFERDD